MTSNAIKRRRERLEKKLAIFRQRDEDTTRQEKFVQVQLERLKQLKT